MSKIRNTGILSLYLAPLVSDFRPGHVPLSITGLLNILMLKRDINQQDLKIVRPLTSILSKLNNFPSPHKENSL